MVAPLGMLEVHTSQGEDTGICSEGLASLLSQNGAHLSSGKHEGIHDHQLQIPWCNASCRCSSFDVIGQSICWHRFVSPSLLPLSQYWNRR
jgi:hypothetical protein